MSDLDPRKLYKFNPMFLGYKEEEFLIPDSHRKYVLGGIYFYVNSIPSQCGAYLLNSFDIRGSYTEERADNFIQDLRKFGKRVALLQMSARQGQKIYQYLNRWPLHAGNLVRNPNSGKYIQFFELPVKPLPEEKV